MTVYRIDESQVIDAESGQILRGLAGQPVQIVLRDTTTPATILDGPAGAPIPDSTLTVTAFYSIPRYWIDTTAASDLYMDWYDAASGARGPVTFDAVLRDQAAAAQAAAEAAAENTVGTVKSVNGQAPDENGNVTVSGAGGSGVVVLPPQPSPVPEGTPSGTLIARAASVPPPGEMAVVTETATTFSAASGSDVSLSLPSGLAAGDLLIAVITHATTGSTWTAPAGWTLVQNLDNANSDFRATAVYALDVDAESPAGSQVFTNNTSGRLAGAMFRVTGADLTTPLLAGGAIGSRPGNTYTVPELVGAAGGLVLSVTNGQKASGDPAPQPLVYSNALAPFASILSAPSGTGAQTFLDIAWENAVADFAEHTVTTAGVSITAMGSQVLALRSAA